MNYCKWAMIELLGHRSHYGLVSEVTGLATHGELIPRMTTDAAA